MSAPPRSVVDLRPLRDSGASGILRPSSAPPAHGRRDRDVTRGPSARLYARVCLVGLLATGAAHRPLGRDIADGLRDGPADLVRTLTLLLDGDGRKSGVDEPDAHQRPPLSEWTPDELHDALLDRLNALGDLDLPPLLIARRIDIALRAPRIAPRKALRLLAGTAGNLFVRARSAGTGAFLTGLPGAAGVACQFDYWLPTGVAAT
jgi:hypothetical protein